MKLKITVRPRPSSCYHLERVWGYWEFLQLYKDLTQTHCDGASSKIAWNMGTYPDWQRGFGKRSESYFPCKVNKTTSENLRLDEENMWLMNIFIPGNPMKVAAPGYLTHQWLMSPTGVYIPHRRTTYIRRYKRSRRQELGNYSRLEVQCGVWVRIWHYFEVLSFSLLEILSLGLETVCPYGE